MIVGADVVASAIAMLPSEVIKTTFVLKSQQPKQAGYTDVAWGFARRLSKPPSDQSEILLAGALDGDYYHTFELFKTSETVDPKIGDMIRDDEGVTWQIKKIDKTMMHLIFRCLCLQNK